MRRSILTLVLPILVCCYSFAQNVVSTTNLGSRSAAELNIGLILLGSSVLVEYDVDLIGVEYTTTGSDGMEDVASGLFIVPRDYDGELPLHVHMHGTTTRNEVPSTLGGGYELGLFYAAKGHFVLMPDYLGMGSSRGFHPYVHRATQATAGWDLLLAAQEYAETQNDISISQKLSVAGYSQGGHAAMAFQQLVETEHSQSVDLFASTPMSGPYDLSGAFRNFLLNESEYFFPGYVIYQIAGYNEVYGDIYNDLADVIKEPYVEAAKAFEMTGTGLGDLNSSLSELLIQNEGKSIPLRLFKDEVIDAFITDEMYPLNIHLADNDTYNFISKVPSRLIYCTADDQVPFTNSVTADSIFNSNGSEDVSSVDVDPTADHGGCVVPAVEESLRFIGQFLETTSTEDILDDRVKISVYPNPTINEIFVNSQADLIIEKLSVFNANAQLVMKHLPLSKSIVKVDVSGLTAGTYVLVIETERGMAYRKMVKQN